MSALASDADTAVPDSAGDFPLRVVRSVPLLPDGHSATTDSARVFLRLNTVESVVSIVLRVFGTHEDNTMQMNYFETKDGGCIPSLLAASPLVEEGALPACDFR